MAIQSMRYVPRERGDEPVQRAWSEHADLRHVPRERGDEPAYRIRTVPSLRVRDMFPASAGMNRRTDLACTPQ